MTALAEPRASAFWPAFAALVAGAVAMGVSPIFVRLADVGPFASAFYRVALALPALYAWMKAEDAQTLRAAGGRAVVLPAWSWTVVAAGFFFAGDLFFWHLAILNTSVANATFFATTAPVWVVVFGWLIYRRRVSTAALGGLGLCLLGGGALVWQSATLAPGHLAGDLMAEATAVFFGAYFLAVEQARERYRAARATFFMTLVTAAILGAVAIVATVAFGQRALPAGVQGWAVLAALALVSHVGGQGLLAVALGSLPATFSSLVIFLEAVAAALLAWAILGEAVTALQGLGGLAILAGIWIARPRRDRAGA